MQTFQSSELCRLSFDFSMASISASTSPIFLSNDWLRGSSIKLRLDKHYLTKLTLRTGTFSTKVDTTATLISFRDNVHSESSGSVASERVGFGNRKNLQTEISSRRAASFRKICYSSMGAAAPNEPFSMPSNENMKNGETVSFGRKLRAVMFYFWTLTLSIPLFITMLVIHPFVVIFDKYKRRAQHFVNNLWAIATMALFYKVEIIGRENLPSPDVAAVYVANHQSFLDIFTLFALLRPFKFISKTENFMIPIIGWSMYLTGHVPLKRMDSRSQRECLMKCLNLLKEGAAVLFFPEGTRTKDGKMAEFKKGAFSVAAKAKVPIVPISLIGTGHLMPNTQEGTLRPGKVTVVVHPQILGSNADDLCEKSRAVIAETLTKYGLGVHQT